MSSIPKEPINLCLSDSETVLKIGKALNSPIRLNILSALIERSLSMTEIAERFYLSMSSVSMHIQILKEAGLISVQTSPGIHGVRRVCGIRTSSIHIDMFADTFGQPSRPTAIIETPIGNYTNCEITAPCGIVTPNSYIECEDSPLGFYEPNHVDASLLWFTSGMLEYQLPTKDLQRDGVSQVSISFEICSEAPGYNNDWPSDISIEINNILVTTFTVRGDYGGRHGINNPSWWSSSNTQFGELKNLIITNDACYLGEQKVSSHTIKSLNLKNGYYFLFRLKIDPTSKHVGGLNLFGKQFGDFPQDIIMKIEY